MQDLLYPIAWNLCVDITYEVRDKGALCLTNFLAWVFDEKEYYIFEYLRSEICINFAHGDWYTNRQVFIKILIDLMERNDRLFLIFLQEFKTLLKDRVVNNRIQLV